MPERAFTYRRWFNQPVVLPTMFIGVLVLIHAILPAFPVYASSVEYRVKSAFLYNFTKFIEWPADTSKTGRPFCIGILGEDPFADAVEPLAGKSVGNRSLTVKRFANWNPAAGGCDILFISRTQERQLEEIIRRVDGLPVLTVGDTPNYAHRGVMINFFMADNKVRFMINLDKARRAGFNISSRLLKLAAVIE